jgi:hypothetical protein
VPRNRHWNPVDKDILAVSFLSVALGEKPVFDSLAGS